MCFLISGKNMLFVFSLYDKRQFLLRIVCKQLTIFAFYYLFMEIIQKYFTDITEAQIEQFAKLQELYKDWNLKINVVSRKDIDELYLRHVLHSLGIAKVMQFKPGSKVMDVGAGGGFP